MDTIKDFGTVAKGLAKNPLGIIALFIVLIYGLASIVVGFSDKLQHDERLPIIYFLAIFPAIVLGVFAWLVSKHHLKLYAPDEIPVQFIELFKNSSRDIISFASVGKTNIFSPFHYHNPLSTEQVDKIKQTVSKVEPILQNMHSNDFEVLHSWYNSINKHEMALLCINIALASGGATSKNFSFKSASLRKMGRTIEALHSALIAIELEPNNIDANYNLSVIYKTLGNQTKAKENARIVYSSEQDAYKEKLKVHFELDSLNS